MLQGKAGANAIVARHATLGVAAAFPGGPVGRVACTYTTKKKHLTKKDEHLSHLNVFCG